MDSNPFISVVSPTYQAAKIVPQLVSRIAEETQKITNHFEIILVEDGSKDESWAAIVQAAKEHPFVKGVKLSRNFGQHYAITAGLIAAKGDYVVVIDCDLQENPKYISNLYGAALKGNDVVLTYKRIRRHGFFKNLSARAFFAVFNFLIDNKDYEATKHVGALSMLSRKAVNAFLAYKEFHRHYLTIVRMIGFQRTYIEIEHENRYEGKSSYTFSKLMRHALDGITSQSEKLLRLAAGIGFLLFIGSLIWVAVIVTLYFRTHLFNGYASTMSVQLLGTGLILIFMGVLGLYIGNIFAQVRERPLYIVDKTVNLDD
jgi:glycosyltransferase involved in cell wall biosynthesis